MTKVVTTEEMKSNLRSGDGFTLIELLISILILSVIMTAIFSFLWGVTRYWKSGQNAADVTENARLGLNRMTRELKQGSLVSFAGSNQVTFTVNFGMGNETVTYGFTSGSGGEPGLVWRTSGTGPQVSLIENVDTVQFTYYGNDYRCDTVRDGLVKKEELDNCYLYAADPEAGIARVDVELTMRAGSDPQQIFVGQAWLRNRTE